MVQPERPSNSGQSPVSSSRPSSLLQPLPAPAHAPSPQDINKPLDDVSAKLVSLYEDVGMRKRAVRLYAWRYETKKGICDWTQGLLPAARHRLKSRRSSFLTRRSARAPTLDEMAWEVCESNREYADLARTVRQVLQDPSKNTANFKMYVEGLYRDVWGQIDTIFCTPVTATHVPSAKGSDGKRLWDPDLVMFDESAHAKEASLLISVAQFNRIAWFFAGDFRQTMPHVADRDNPQLLRE